MTQTFAEELLDRFSAEDFNADNFAPTESRDVKKLSPLSSPRLDDEINSDSSP